MSLLPFIRQKWIWARSNPFPWAFLLVAVGTYAVIWLWPGPIVDRVPSDTRLRLWALALQVLGGATVLRDLAARATGHGHTGPIRAFVSWLRAAVARHHTASVSAAIIGGSATAKGRGYGRMKVDPAAPLADQVLALDYNLESAAAQIAGLAGELDAAESALKAAIKAEEQQRAEADSEIRETMRRDALGNFGILYFGAFWVLIGTVLSGLAPEIVRLAAGQWEAVLRGL